MRGLHETIARLKELQKLKSVNGAGAEGRLRRMKFSGSNPGDLIAHEYAPDELERGAALVVVLHGCTQTASSYDHGSGWSQLADRHGFALLFPEQQRSNNANLCFNWFEPGDTRRDKGELLSIRQMIDAAVLEHGIDPKRIFITGLSAGGAMTAAMLVSYPEVFAGGAIIGGLPYGCASTIPEAFDRMRGQGIPDVRGLAARARAASSHSGSWPRLSVWHGSEDQVVSQTNAEAIVAQWAALTRTSDRPSRVEMVDGHRRTVWLDEDGRPVLESYSISGMGHGVPLATSQSTLGTPGPFMLEAGICSTAHMADAWGLTQAPAASKRDARVAEHMHAETETTRVEASLDGGINLPDVRRLHPYRTIRPEPKAQPQAGVSGIGKVIEDALRSAGLMR